MELVAAILGGAMYALFKKYCSDSLANAIDWFARNVIIKNERRLWIWLHHRLKHDAPNALLCEREGCAKVKPR